MSDPLSVGAAYTIVLGGLAFYVASIARRTRAARRMAAALERERARDSRDPAPAAVAHGVGPVEAPR